MALIASRCSVIGSGVGVGTGVAVGLGVRVGGSEVAVGFGVAVVFGADVGAGVASLQAVTKSVSATTATRRPYERRPESRRGMRCQSSMRLLSHQTGDLVLAGSHAAAVAPPAASPADSPPSAPGVGAAAQRAAVAGTQAGVPVGVKSAAKVDPKVKAKDSVNGIVVPTSVAAKLPRGLLVGVASFVVAVALGGYAWTGSPSLAGLGAPPPVPAAAAGHGGGDGPQGVSMEQIAEMATRLATRLKDQPQDPQGWAMLGRTYAVLGRNDEAVKAYESAIQQHGDDAVLIADYADALAVKNNRTLAGEPTKPFRLSRVRQHV